MGEIIQRAISKFGCMPEQNAYDCVNNRPKSSENVLFDFGDDKILLAGYNKASNRWHLFSSDILVPNEERFCRLMEFCIYCFKEKNAKKIMMESDDSLFEQLKNEVKKLDSPSLKMSRVRYTYYWPVINLSSWNPDLSGKSWHKIRNMISSLCKKNNVTIGLATKNSKENLKKIVYDWKSNRRGKDRAEYRHYLNLIDNDFKGTDYTSSIIVNGEPCSIAAGWKIPNTNSFYLSLALHNYKLKGLGELMYIESLRHFKNMGLDTVDLGGSGNDLLAFKEKFKPDYIYKTYEFSLARS